MGERNLLLFSINNNADIIRAVMNHKEYYYIYYSYEEWGRGLYGRTKEQKKEDCMKGVLKAKELGIGLFALTQEFRSEHGKKMHKLGLGVHSLTSEEKAEYASISGKEVSARKYMCTETGFVANAGNLAIYQRARGIDTSNRIRLS